MASWLVHSPPDWEVQVWALAGRIVLRCRARHFTFSVPLTTQVYKWAPANFMQEGNPAKYKHFIQGGPEILPVASCYWYWDKHHPDGPLGCKQTLSVSSSNNTDYYTLNSLSLFWLAKSVQWIFKISACDVTFAYYTIIISRSRVIIKFALCVAWRQWRSKNITSIVFVQCIIKQLLDSVFVI